MKTELAAHGSGKTRFTREKKQGQSWTKLRDDARREGTFRLPVKARDDRENDIL
jgi:hypothetical protein